MLNEERRLNKKNENGRREAYKVKYKLDLDDVTWYSWFQKSKIIIVFGVVHNDQDNEQV